MGSKDEAAEQEEADLPEKPADEACKSSLARAAFFMGVLQVLAEALQEAICASGQGPGCPEGSEVRQVEESKREEEPEPGRHLR